MTNLTATVNSVGHIVLEWEAPDGGEVTGYRILRRRPALDEGLLPEYVANRRSTAATDAAPGVQNVYRVQAIGAAGRGRRSNHVNATLQDRGRLPAAREAAHRDGRPVRGNPFRMRYNQW
jgi:hypothetical protein